MPAIKTILEPYEKLWKTAQAFEEAEQRWLKGGFLSLNAEAIEEEIGNWWRISYKLAKSFTDQKGPAATVELLKEKMDQFKTYLPLLAVICNQGMRDRHWERVSEVSGYDIKPDETTSLAQMLKMNLHKQTEALEEIGAAASKEFSLEKAMNAMKNEWGEIEFSFMPYRDTGVSILSGIDEVQMLLDDHIVKTQTMRGSPFIKPFEEEMAEWEKKLVSMQDILDEWLKCQATWLYLEPIFRYDGFA